MIVQKNPTSLFSHLKAVDLSLPVPDFGYGDLNSTTKSHPGASNVSVNQLLLSWITMKDKQLRSICSNSLKKPRFAKSSRLLLHPFFVLKKRPNQLIAFILQAIEAKSTDLSCDTLDTHIWMLLQLHLLAQQRTSLHLLQRDFDWESPPITLLLLKISTTIYFPFSRRNCTNVEYFFPLS